MTPDRIIEVASQYISLYETIPNTQWTSKIIKNPATVSLKLVTAMEACEWQKGWPYCAAFVEAVMLEAFAEDQAKVKKLKNLLAPSVMLTYSRCKNFIIKEPKPGSIFIMQKAKGATGHAGIVGKDISKTAFSTIEANTSPGQAISAEADRNGDGIYAKSRKLVFDNASKGLHLIGFIDVMAI